VSRYGGPCFGPLIWQSVPPTRSTRSAAPSGCSTPQPEKGSISVSWPRSRRARAASRPSRASPPRTSPPSWCATLNRLVRVATDPYLRREKPRDVLVGEVRARAAAARLARRSARGAAQSARGRAGAPRRARAGARPRHRGRPRAGAPRRRVLRRGESRFFGAELTQRYGRRASPTTRGASAPRGSP